MQHDLFTDPQRVNPAEQLAPEEILLDEEGNGYLQLYRRFFSTTESDFYFSNLKAHIPWRQDNIIIAGRSIAIPRLQAWYGDPEAHYGYSGLALVPLPFLPSLLSIKQKIEGILQLEFNSLLANLYRDQRDSVGWHSDNEDGLGRNPAIASVSFGETRRFSLKPKNKNKNKNKSGTLHLDLGHGDLLLMAGNTQHLWQHQVGKSQQICKERINLTFRKIYVK